MPRKPKPKRVNFCVSLLEDELDLLRSAANETGLSMTQIVRLTLQPTLRQFAERGNRGSVKQLARPLFDTQPEKPDAH